MTAYHEIASDKAEDVLKHGLKRTSRGDKGDDQSIIKTDEFLDAHCPAELKDRGVSRDDNVYAYVCVDDAIVDITDGSIVPLKDFISRSEQTVLELNLDPTKCYVSDLDTYDEMKAAMHEKKNDHVLTALAETYWSKLIRLDVFKNGTIQRPEIMITYDLPADVLRAT